MLLSKPWKKGRYVYKGTDVLINVPGIRDFDALHAFERESVAYRAMSVGSVRGNFDKDHICRIHKHLFEAVYPWAGELRTTNILKNGAQFCDGRLLEKEFVDLHDAIEGMGYMRGGDLSVDRLTSRLTEVFTKLDYLHPFREGNGRVTRVVLCELAENAGYDLVFTHVSKDDWVHASRCAHQGSPSVMQLALKHGLSEMDMELRSDCLQHVRTGYAIDTFDKDDGVDHER